MIYLNKRILYNLTKPQESIWFSEQFSNSPANNIIGTILFKKGIDISLLKAAVYLTSKKNQTLRTKLVIDKNSTMPKQYFDDPYDLDIPVIDLSSKTMDDFEQLRKEYCAEKFDLINHFLFKFIIVILPNDEIALVGKFHHLIADAWSLGLVIDNIAINYTNLADDAVDYALNPGNYTDFIERESTYLNSKLFSENKDF